VSAVAYVLPISKLTNNPEYLSMLCHEQPQPVFLTKDGYNDLALMSVELYEQLKENSDAYLVSKNQNEDKKLVTNYKNNKNNDEEESNDGIKKLPHDAILGVFKGEMDRHYNK
jgi:PHD/YefM family antitoxin component YafN of YafNO toxin-antitoxin module